MGYKLLLADDSITIQKVVELVLAGEGFDIKTANNGDEALSLIPSFKPDVVLADIAMPVMNGYQLCERIKRNPETRSVPVILLAGAFEPLDEELARNVGADDHIVKPFESQELITKVGSVLAGGAMAEEVPLEEVGAEPVETVVADEDLWSMEEMSAEPVTAEGISEEIVLDEEVLLEEPLGVSEEFGMEAEEEKLFMEEAAARPVVEEPPVKPIRPEPIVSPAVREVELPSREDVLAVVKRSIDERVASLVSSADLRDAVMASLAPTLKDTTEKVLWEIAPQLIEKLLKEMLQGVLAALSKEVEKVIWETVPDLAATMISREIERIKSEI